MVETLAGILTLAMNYQNPDFQSLGIAPFHMF